MQINELTRLDYATLGRFLGIAEMAADRLMKPEDAARRIVEIFNEYNLKAEEIRCA